MPTYIVCGPTASGKSKLALDIALYLNGGIINADSMQSYEKLPILSAQPSVEDQKLVRHFLYGDFSVTEVNSSGKWLSSVQNLLKESSFQIPVFVGGTGLYIKALLEGLSPIPEIPGFIRQQLSVLAKTTSKDDLFGILQKEDPLTAEKIDPYNTQRILRALEVMRYTHLSLTEWQKISKEKMVDLPLPIKVILIDPNREALYDHINHRTEHMMKMGAIEEVKSLKEKNIILSTAAQKMLGYEEISAYLDGHLSRGEMIEQIQQRTRQYAKRQMTWFRHQIKPDFIWPKIYKTSDWKDFLSEMKLSKDSDTPLH